MLSILIIQLLWVQKTIERQRISISIQQREDSLNQKEFQNDVQVALREVIETVEINTSNDVYGAVRMVSNNQFIVDLSA